MSEPGHIHVCALGELATGMVRAVPLSRDDEGRPRQALVLRDLDGKIRAYLNRCRHLPIPIDGGSRRFLSADGKHLVCGTHGALYRLNDGHCIAGPCEGLGLVHVPIVIEAQGIYVVDL